MSTISSSISPFGFLHAKPIKGKQDEQGNPADPNDPAALKSPNADLLRMIQGIMAPKNPKQANAANASSNTDAQSIYAQIKVGGKTVATIYNDGSTESSNAIAAKTKLSDGQGPDTAQKRSEELAAAAGGKIVKSSGALTQAQWSASQADKAGTAPQWDAVQQEKQQFYAGTQSRQMLANPSMLVQAQLFGQQLNQSAQQPPAARVILNGNTMTSGGATA